MSLKVTQKQIDEIKALIPEDLSFAELRAKFQKVKGRPTTLSEEQLIVAQAATDDDDDDLLAFNMEQVEKGNYEIAA